jgi:glucan biosynthesis protein C
VTSGRFLGGSGPMWFAVALFIFSAVYALVRAGKMRKTHDETALFTSWHVLGFALLVGTCSFLVRTIQPIGTNILNMQLCFFSQYVLLFLAGLRAYRQDWLRRIPYQFGMRWFALAVGAGSFLWAALLFGLLQTHTEDKLTGGLTWQSAAYSFWEAFFCVGVCLGLIVLFRDNFNAQGKFARWLSDNCFAVYVFHPPVLIAITLALRGWDAPKLVKFSAATILGVAVTYLVSSLLLRRIPVLKRIL